MRAALAEWLRKESGGDWQEAAFLVFVGAVMGVIALTLVTLLAWGAVQLVLAYGIIGVVLVLAVLGAVWWLVQLVRDATR